MTTWDPIVIRRSELLDAAALRRLAALDSRKLPQGRFLVAETGGELIAAAPLESDEPALSDPFRPTAEVQRLLEKQAESIRAALARAA